MLLRREQHMDQILIVEFLNQQMADKHGAKFYL
jgi:hypothetical protein